MSKKLVVNSHELIVNELYPYRYDYGKGKEVLRIKIAEANHSFEEIKALDNTGLEECPVIEYWEENEKKNDYSEYNADFSSNYLVEEGVKIFSIEITRKGATELAMEKVHQQMKQTQEAIDFLLMQ